MTDELTGGLAEQSWELRQRMDELVRLNVSEDDALAMITDHDPERFGMLEVWREKGLWPVSESERLMRCSDPEGLSRVTEIEDLISENETLPGGGRAEDSGKGMPADWMEQILGTVRVTLNAAILDYHNQFGARIEERVSALEERTARLKGSEQPELRQDEIRKIVERLVRESVARARPEAQSVAAFELKCPPEPRVQFGSRKVSVERSRLTGNCDKALLDLFNRDRKVRGYDESEMLDFILYNFYDRPALSFQINEEEGSEQP